MMHLFLPRGAGKTSRLLAKACSDGCDILVATRRMGDSLIDTAKLMGIPGKINRDPRRGPPSIGDVRVLIPADLRYRDGDRHEKRPILIDELDLVLPALLGGRLCAGYSVTYPDVDATIPLRVQAGQRDGKEGVWAKKTADSSGP